MDTQPYCLRNGWVVNADTGLPIARLDHDAGGNSIFVFPGCSAITVDNIAHIVNQVKYVEAAIERMHDQPLYPWWTGIDKKSRRVSDPLYPRCEDCGYKHPTTQSCPMYIEPPGENR